MTTPSQPETPCTRCGTPIPPERIAHAARVAKVAAYCTDVCRRRAADARRAKAAKAMLKALRAAKAAATSP